MTKEEINHFEEKGLTVQNSARNLKEGGERPISTVKNSKTKKTNALKKVKNKKKALKSKGAPEAVYFEESAQGIWSKEEEGNPKPKRPEFSFLFRPGIIVTA